MQHHQSTDHGEWLNFHLPLGEQVIPVRISRAAMEQHFDARSFPNLTEAFRHHAEQISLRAAGLAQQGTVYTAESPLVVDAEDLT